jgi:hypothetical protein
VERIIFYHFNQYVCFSHDIAWKTSWTSLIYIYWVTTYTSLSPIWRGFVPVFVNYKKGCTRLAAPCDKAYQLLAHRRWFSLGTSPSSITKTGRHDINRYCIPSNNFGFLHLTNGATHPLDGFEKMNSEKLNLTFKFSHSLNALYDFTVIMPYFRSLHHPVRMVLSWGKIMFKRQSTHFIRCSVVIINY